MPPQHSHLGNGNEGKSNHSTTKHKAGSCSAACDGALQGCLLITTVREVPAPTPAPPPQCRHRSTSPQAGWILSLCSLELRHQGCSERSGSLQSIVGTDMQMRSTSKRVPHCFRGLEFFMVCMRFLMFSLSPSITDMHLALTTRSYGGFFLFSSSFSFPEAGFQDLKELYMYIVRKN